MLSKISEFIQGDAPQKLNSTGMLSLLLYLIGKILTATEEHQCLTLHEAAFFLLIIYFVTQTSLLLQHKRK